MKYLMCIPLLLIAGCGYDYNELNAAKAACATAGGKFSSGTMGQTIIETFCSIDGVRYRIGRTTYGFYEGKQE